jgi:hypothetical protein
MNPKSLANLRPFKSGADWSGNAGGRPTQLPLTASYRRFLEQPIPEWWRKRLRRSHHIELSPTATWSDAIGAARVADAVLETSAAREIREAVEGKSTMRVQTLTTETLDHNGQFTNGDTLEEARERLIALTATLRAKYASEKREPEQINASD